MNRFFVAPSDISENSAYIRGGDVAHISKVLRLGIGDEVRLCDGEKNEYTARIAELKKDAVRVELLTKGVSKAEDGPRITLYQGLPKAGKMELIIQKAVELGASCITPFAAERSVVRLDPVKDGSARRARYERIALEAAKQCGRGIVPEIGETAALSKYDFSKHDLIIAAYEEEKENFIKCVLERTERPDDIAVVIGPEGGLERSEMSLLINAGAKVVSLGERILRTETAGLAVLSMLLYEYGDRA